MVRSQRAPPFSAPVTVYDPYLDLGRLLNRLDQTILRADGDRWRRLVADEFQRLQARFDVAAASSLLARVEQDAAAGKAGARRQDWHDVQSELSRRRTLVERLQERLDDLDEEARAAAMAEGEEREDDGLGLGLCTDGAAADDVLAHIIATPSEQLELDKQLAETPTDTPRAVERGPGARKTKKTVRITAQVASMAAMTTATMPTATAAPTATATAAPPQATMRARKSKARSGSSPDKRQGTSTSAHVDESSKTPTAPTVSTVSTASTASLKHALLSASGANAEAGVAAEEVVLDHHRHEQEALSADILRLAQALKEQSVATSRLLEDDKDVVDRVGEGLHTTNEHLTAASRSMAVLARMTEGKGWWGRMLLFGMVYGLMVVLVLLFLFLPKLRL